MVLLECCQILRKSQGHLTTAVMGGYDSAVADPENNKGGVVRILRSRYGN